MTGFTAIENPDGTTTGISLDANVDPASGAVSGYPTEVQFQLDSRLDFAAASQPVYIDTDVEVTGPTGTSNYTFRVYKDGN